MENTKLGTTFFILSFAAVTALSCAKSTSNGSIADPNTNTGGEDTGNGGAVRGPQVYQCGGESFTSSTYSVGTSINGQNGWYVDPAASFNEKIESIGTSACRGSGVWKISNSVISGGFGNQPQSPAFTKASGESSVRSSGGGDSMGVSFFIRTVSTIADGSAFTLSLSPTSADRHTYLRFINNFDSSSGFNIYGIDGVNLDQTHYIGTGLNRGSWMHIKIESENPDGVGNDIVRVYLNGSLVSTYSSWEDWRVALPATTLNITRVLFRVSALGTSIDTSFTNPFGFYIDDFKQWSYSSGNSSVHIEEFATGFEAN